jgi:hypothetical protein
MVGRFWSSKDPSWKVLTEYTEYSKKTSEGSRLGSNGKLEVT